MELIRANPEKIGERGVYLNKSWSKLFIVGVIDTLTVYNSKKKFEYYAKRCRHGQ